MAAPGHDLASLIARARDPVASLPDRHQAFAELVRRFQNVAIASAYARLRDRALAEDAAQDAFLAAWERLDQLRQPDAFPGWILRLVFTQCHRRLRVARLPIVPDGDARRVASRRQPADLEAAHDRRFLQRALSGLSPSDRLVLSLFYGCGRSHREIADWLGVPVTTVARRLAHAKRRLRRTALALLSGALRAGRLPARDTFAVDLSARLRRAEGREANDLAGIAARPTPEGAHPGPLFTPVSAYVVEDPGTNAPVAYAAARQTIFEPIYELQFAIADAALGGAAGDALLMQVFDDLRARQAIAVRHHTSSRHAALVAFLLSRGFEIAERTQDWRFTAAPAAPVPAEHPRWEFRRLDALDEQPALFDQALHIVANAVEDDPAARGFLPIHPAAFRRALRAQASGVVVLAGGRVRGLIGGSADAAAPDGLRIGLLAVARGARRRGIATALLHRLLACRRAASARMTTPERPDLVAWLASRGFVRTDDVLVVERLLRKSVRVAPERLDEYVGEYVVQDAGREPVVVARAGDSLISKVRDMRDVLVAASDCEFFTRHHYGRGRFERDGSGRVTRLVITEGARQLVASRLRVSWRPGPPTASAPRASPP